MVVGIEVAVKHLGTKSSEIGCMSGEAGALPKCEVETPMTPDHSNFRVHSSG